LRIKYHRHGPVLGGSITNSVGVVVHNNAIVGFFSGGCFPTRLIDLTISTNPRKESMRVFFLCTYSSSVNKPASRRVLNFNNRVNCSYDINFLRAF
jgi:hypothetical protein